MNAPLAIAGIVIKELYRRKDFYVLFVLTAVITLVLGSVNVFGDDRVVRYLKEICLRLIHLSSLVIAIGTAARQIPSERENRTLFTLLAKPVSRAEVILGKFLGCWAAVGLCLLVFYSFFAAISASREHTLPLFSYIQAIGLHWMMLAVVVAMTLLGSLVFAAPSSNGTIVFVVVAGILLMGQHLAKVALRLEEPAASLVYAIYFALPHLEFFDISKFVVHNWSPIAWMDCLLAGLYGLVYTLFFLTAAWWRFRRQSLTQS